MPVHAVRLVPAAATAAPEVFARQLINSLAHCFFLLRLLLQCIERLLTKLTLQT